MQPKKPGLILILTFFILSTAVLVPVVPVWAAPALVLSQTSGPTGTLVEIRATGFDISETTASVTFSNASTTFKEKVIAAVPVVSGNCTVSFHVPVFPRGLYTVTVETLTSESAGATFQIIPAIALKTPSGQTGSQISVTGTGFNANNTINGYFDNSLINTTTSDSNGSFSNLLITIPETYKGIHSIRAADSSGPSSSIEYTVLPRLSVIPVEASVGNQVNVSGTGFSPTSSISFSLDNLLIDSVVTTNPAGSFTATPLTVPIIYSGEHTLKATDLTGALATATLSTKGVFSINPQSGPANTLVTISGIGFGPNKNIIVTFNGVNIGTYPSVVTSDANGNFSAAITIPGTASGTFPVAVTDGTTSLTANFTAAATAKATQNQGPVGGNIPINGNGFNAGNTINIKFDDVQIGTATADNTGAFSAILPAPVTTAGEHKVVATDGVNSINFIFTIIPFAKINTDNGHVGSEIIVSGTSFKPKGTINIKFGDLKVPSTNADGNGVFSTTFKAPAVRGGKQVITVTDETTTFIFNFNMETAPPLAPELLSPTKESKADALAELRLAPVTDPSGITYKLEVSHDSSFSDLLIEKSGLTSPKYQLNEEEKLLPTSQDQPYYWRVRAIDGAFNESIWSPVFTFVVGFTLPLWVWYAVGVIAAVLLFGTGFFLGRYQGR